MRFAAFIFLLVVTSFCFLGAMNGPKAMAVLFVLWAFLALNNMIFLSEMRKRVRMGRAIRQPLAVRILGSLDHEKITRYALRALRNFNPAFALWLGMAIIFCVWTLGISVQVPQDAYAQNLMEQIALFLNNAAQPVGTGVIYNPWPYALTRLMEFMLYGFIFINTLVSLNRRSQEDVMTPVAVSCFCMALTFALTQGLHIHDLWPENQGAVPLGGAYMSIIGDQMVAPSYLHVDFKRRIIEFGTAPALLGAGLLLVPLYVFFAGLVKGRLKLMQFIMGIGVLCGLAVMDLIAHSHFSHKAVWVFGLVSLGLIWSQAQQRGVRFYRIYQQ